MDGSERQKILTDHSREIKIFSCNENKELAESVANRLGLTLGKSETGRFSDGEIKVTIGEKVRQCDVYIIQPTCAPVNDRLMELLIMTDALKRASAGRINAVLPYFSYARQDRKARARDPISAKLVANLITTAGADRVITMDLHSAQIQGFFDIPVDHLQGAPLLADYFKSVFPDLSDFTVVSPDLGSVARARSFAARLNCPLAIVDKRRPRDNEVEVMNLIGEVKGRKVILLDDMIDTAGTLIGAAEATHKEGALEVYACCTHGVLSGKAVERINASCIKQVIMLDTIPTKVPGEKFKILPIDKAFADAIENIHNGESISTLFT